MLYPLLASCTKPCLADLANLRQVHLATGRMRNRVAVWLLSPTRLSEDQKNQLLAVYSEADILIDSKGEADRLLNSMAGPDGNQFGGGEAFLLDPSTNIILRYTPGFDPNDIAKDLDRLLTWSSTE